jgi:CheY-like chemotaxis protein
MATDWLPPRSMLTKKADVNRETILVVEDDFNSCALIRIFLENAGYTVVTADDGEEGLRVYKRHQPSIALLLTDIGMPRMNGVDLADRVLQLDSHLPVLFMSGAAPRVKLRFGCLTKPLNLPIWWAGWPRCCMRQRADRAPRDCNDLSHQNVPGRRARACIGISHSSDDDGAAVEAALSAGAKRPLPRSRPRASLGSWPSRKSEQWWRAGRFPT